MIIFELDGVEYISYIVTPQEVADADGTEAWAGATLTAFRDAQGVLLFQSTPVASQPQVELVPITPNQYGVRLDGSLQGSLRLRDGQWVAVLYDFEVPDDMAWESPAEALEALRDVLLER
jgi:hypothetical protein